MEGIIFNLIKVFMRQHRNVEPIEFSINTNTKLDEKFFRVKTNKMLYIWYFERDPLDEDTVRIKKYWCPTHQTYPIGNETNNTNAVHEMMKLGQTRGEIANHLGIHVAYVNKIYKDIVSGILTEKESPYADEFKGGY